MWLPADWRALRQGTPGRRFTEYHAKRRTVHGALLHRAIIAGAVMLMGLGALLLFTPGPGTVLLIGGAAMLTAESAAAARVLDRIEQRARALFRRRDGNG
jgi:hypothetical protein